MKRREAFRIKNVDPLFSLIMCIMPKRYDATNYAMIDIPCEGMDKFIRAQRDNNGRWYSYMQVIIAAIVRGFAMKPQLNRFVMNARMYERYGVTVSMTIKQSLEENAEEMTIKHTFCGHESIAEIADTIDDLIKTSINNHGNAVKDKSDAVGGLPVWLSKAVVKFMRFADKHNCMPKSFQDISPFHTSFFVTNLKSLRMESIMHHCYDFGTTSMFFSIGKEKWQPVVDENRQIVPGKILKLGISSDERICDGYYFSTSFHLLKQLIEHPDQLLEEYHDAKTDAEIARQAEAKQKLAAKQAKAKAK